MRKIIITYMAHIIKLVKSLDFRSTKTDNVPKLYKFNIQNSTFKILTALLLFSCQSEERERPEAPDQVEILPEVIFAVTDDQPLHFHLDTRGIVEPIREVPVISRVGGFIRKHQIFDGRRVNAGDTLLAFVDDEWRIGLEEAQNEFLRAQQEYELEARQRNASRNRNAQLNGDNPPVDTTRIDPFDDRLLRNQTGYMQAKTALDRARLELSYTYVNATFGGEIFTEELHSDGAYIPAGQKMGRLIDYSRVQVRFDVLESEMTLLRTGMEVTITAADGTQKNGRITAISPVIDRDRKTGQIIVEADNRDRILKPGMSVDGRVFVESAQGRVRAPRSAMLSRDGRPLVFKLNNDQVEWVYIDPQAITSDWIIINEPTINPGDTLAVERHFAISHLQRVRPTIRDY